MAEDLFQQIEQLVIKAPRLTLKDAEEFKSGYMITRFLSMNQRFFINTWWCSKYYGKIPNWAYAYLLFYSIPKQKGFSSKYIKGEKEVKTKQQEVVLKKIQEAFCCNIKHSVQILNCLTSQGLKVTELFGIK
jgi:hypothetical protein